MAKTLGHRPRPRHNRPRLSDMSAPIDPLDPLPSIEGGGSTLLDERRTSTDDGDHERFAHYVKKDKILESAVSGQTVRALCGKKWVPGRDPSRFPVCPDCQQIYQGLPPGGSSGSGSGGSN